MTRRRRAYSRALDDVPPPSSSHGVGDGTWRRCPNPGCSNAVWPGPVCTCFTPTRPLRGMPPAGVTEPEDLWPR